MTLLSLCHIAELLNVRLVSTKGCALRTLHINFRQEYLELLFSCELIIKATEILRKSELRIPFPFAGITVKLLKGNVLYYSEK